MSRLLLCLASGAAILSALAPVHRLQSRGAPADPLDALNWLVGLWRAEAKTPGGQPAVNEFRVERAPHGRALRYTITQSSGGVSVPTLTGLCAWHPGRQRFSIWEVDAAGAVTEGTMREVGGAFVYEETIYGADGSVLPVRAEAVRDGPDTLRFDAKVEQSGEWKVVFRAIWRRAS
jgi:hypothetical protein